MTPPLITLTTDFGLTDSYVAQMKGAILSIAPDARLIDVTHKIPPQDCAVAAAVLADAVGAFPAGTIHLVVVDPGVGTARRRSPSRRAAIRVRRHFASSRLTTAC